MAKRLVSVVSGLAAGQGGEPAAARSGTLPNPRATPVDRHAPGVRRTTSVDLDWPAGRRGPVRGRGRARDLVTGTSGQEARVVAANTLDVLVDARRAILTFASDPPVPGAAALHGLRRHGEIRGHYSALAAAAGLLVLPLTQLVDDLPGALTVADWAWSRWPEWLDDDEAAQRMRHLAGIAGVCAGFVPGSSALATAGDFQEEQVGLAVPGVFDSDARDPLAWHVLPVADGVSLRRARCIEVWQGARLQVEATFQDSASTRTGARAIVHEYTVRATVAPDTLVLEQLEAVPHVLPFVECPAAAAQVGALVGTPLDALRSAAPAILHHTRGCTHLNDVLRALAGVADLLVYLPGRAGGGACHSM